MATETVLTAPAQAPIGTRQAAALFEEIASLANRLDRECYFTHGEAVDDRPAELIELQLDRLRSAICEIGWLADLGSEKLGAGIGPIRGGSAELWLLPPVYNGMTEEIICDRPQVSLVRPASR